MKPSSWRSLLFTFIFLLGVIQSSAYAQIPDDQILSAECDKLLSAQYKANETGAAALIARNGQIIYKKAFGMANLELNVPMQPDMVFRIGSITKQFTAVAILQLMEQGKLSLQDDIKKFIPDYPTHGYKITIEHLLTHTSGIKSYTGMENFGTIERNDLKPEEVINFFKNQPMDFAPGSKWMYNNSGYFLLGYIIEKLSGKTYPQFVEEVFFKPLGMTNSYYGNDSKIIKNRAAGYQNDENGTENADPLSMNLPFSAGSIQSTVEDLYKWNRAVHSYKLLKKETLDLAFIPYKLSDGSATNYGYGWFFQNIQGSPTIEHGGGINGFLTMAKYLPKEDVFVAVFSNSTANPPNDVATKIAALAIGKPQVRAAIREIALSGTGYELGLQHGKQLQTEIAEVVGKWKKSATDQLGKEANQIVKEFFAYAHFDADIKKWTPELYEEVRGIAEGSGQSFNDIMVLNLLDEFWVYVDDPAHHHCSGMGVPARNGNPGYIAQNMDLENYTDGHQILLRLARSAKTPEQLILTHPGLLATNGLNEAGIGACMNTLMQLKGAPSGLPVAFIVRHILNSTSKDDLLKFIQTVPHASGQNYIIGIKGEVYDFEASANKVVRFDPKNANGTVYHTNHPIVNNDIKAWYKAFDPTASQLPITKNSYVRLAAVQKRIASATPIQDALIKETLRSHDDPQNPVCRSFGSWGGTFGSVVMTLTGKPSLQITAGPPDESEYKLVTFTGK
jgi:CubicO group peptidase (beta-lactamase class C family)